MCKNILNRSIAMIGIALLSGCASYHNHVNPMQKLTVASNLVYGQLATQYRQSEMIGAGIGALGDSLLVIYQDRLESELRHKIKDTGIVIQREGNVVRLVLPAGMTFHAMSAELNPLVCPALDALAGVLETYQQTMIEVIGYADVGNPGNRRLSELRAAEISSYLVAKNLRHERFEMVGLQQWRRVRGANGRIPAAQAEIRLLPLQRSMLMPPKENEKTLLKSGAFAVL